MLYALISVVSSVLSPIAAHAQYLPQPGTPVTGGTSGNQYYEPPKCKSGKGESPVESRGKGGNNEGEYCIRLGLTAEKRDNAKNTQNEPPCARTYQEWLDNPHRDFWVEDPDVTALGKGGERSRQFLLWALSRQSIDDHPVILDTWRLSQNVALFFVLIIVIVMGIGIIIGQQGIGFMGSNFSFGVELTPLIIKIAVLLLYILFSARIVLMAIQLSDVLMEFFIRTLGVRQLFNIYFIDTAGSANSISEALLKSEVAYKQFLGCTNWNINAQESVKTSKALIKFTNMTYYFIGGMLILRKIVLWFLLIVSPFLAILAPFIFIRNTGWIWMGVFFQWIFYGPLMALFLGGLSNIWNSAPVHIPYIFDFSRVNDMAQVIYPTAINILYGGPAQKLGIFNTSNYVDTFAEYLISLMMLWTVLILPWWLLRIFRDYCCEGIYAMKNVLLSMYDTMRASPGGPGPTPVAPTPLPTGSAKLAMQLPDKVKTGVETRVKLETVQDVKRAQTENILRSVNMQASTITQVARMETDQITRKQVTENLHQIQNPFKAETPTERQRLMNVRNEIQERAKKGDVLAQRLAAVMSQSSVHEKVSKERLLQTMPKVTAVPVITRVTVTVPQERQQTITQTALNYVARSSEIMNTLAQQTGLSVQQTTNILQTFNRITALDTSTDIAVSKTAQEVGVEETRVQQVIAKTATMMKSRTDILEIVARSENVDKETVSQTIQTKLRGAIGVTTQKSTEIAQRVLTQVSYDNQAVQQIAQGSQLPEQQTRQILQALGGSAQLDISLKSAVDETAQKTGVAPAQVRKVASQTAFVVGANANFVQSVATDLQVETGAAQDVAQEKIEAVSMAEKEIEDYVPPSQKVSIEDYEEVKSMWIQHYETAEIPVTENVTSRQEWVDQDVVRISNILNKLLSPNRQLQEQGLNDVGYILPIFMVNNLTGEELLVYLKAKIQAAKEVSKSLRREEEVMKKAKGEEELVEIERPKEQAAAKAEVLSVELPEDGATAVAKDTDQAGETGEDMARKDDQEGGSQTAGSGEDFTVQPQANPSQPQPAKLQPQPAQSQLQPDLPQQQADLPQLQVAEKAPEDQNTELEDLKKTLEKGMS